MRLIDADALKFRDVKATTNEIDPFGFGDYYVAECKGILQEEIWNAPTIDAVPVVRCKDCKRCHRFANDSNSNMKSWCLKFSLSKRVNDDDFCAWGERKEDEL